jgi:hypothetical protein
LFVFFIEDFVAKSRDVPFVCDVGEVLSEVDSRESAVWPIVLRSASAQACWRCVAWKLKACGIRKPRRWGLVVKS